MELVKGINELIKQADKEVEVVFAKQLIEIQKSEKVTIVDIRDIRELWKEGKIKGSIHAPRGMLEFWVDPNSPYHREVFSTGNKFILYCKSGPSMETKKLCTFFEKRIFFTIFSLIRASNKFFCISKN